MRRAWPPRSRGARSDADKDELLEQEREVSERRPTEARNAKARGLESFTTRQILELMNDEDASVPPSVRSALPAIERAVD